MSENRAFVFWNKLCTYKYFERIASFRPDHGVRLSKLPARTVEARLDYQEKGKEKLSENRSLPPVVASARELAASSLGQAASSSFEMSVRKLLLVFFRLCAPATTTSRNLQVFQIIGRPGGPYRGFLSTWRAAEQAVHVSNFYWPACTRLLHFVPKYQPKPELSGTVYVSSVAWWQQTIRPRVDLLVHICTDAPGLLPRIEKSHNNSSLRVFLATIKDV